MPEKSSGPRTPVFPSSKSDGTSSGPLLFCVPLLPAKISFSDSNGIWWILIPSERVAKRSIRMMSKILFIISIRQFFGLFKCVFWYAIVCASGIWIIDCNDRQVSITDWIFERINLSTMKKLSQGIFNKLLLSNWYDNLHLFRNAKELK